MLAALRITCAIKLPMDDSLTQNTPTLSRFKYTPSRLIPGGLAWLAFREVVILGADIYPPR